MNRLKAKELNDLRIYIARLCNISSGDILLNEYGRFEIYQVNEMDKDFIVRRLRSDSKILEVTASPSGYNFNRMSYSGLPSRKYTVRGVVNIEPEEFDDEYTGLQ